MKSRSLVALILVTSFFCSTVQLHARVPAGHNDYSPDSMAIDAVVARPLCFAATLVGMGLFIVSLPVTLVSGSSEKAAKTLVGKPAQLTFTRKLGNFSDFD